VLCGTTEVVRFPIEIKNNVKVKGDGQECPSHMGNIKRDANSHARQKKVGRRI